MLSLCIIAFVYVFIYMCIYNFLFFSTLMLFCSVIDALCQPFGLDKPPVFTSHGVKKEVCASLFLYSSVSVSY